MNYKSTANGWLARWHLNGKENIRSFSINKYGEEGAKLMAIAARQTIQPELDQAWNDNYWNYRPHTISEKGYIEEPFAFEGEKVFVLHQAAERDRSLRTLKIEAFLAEHGRLFCEVCGFSYERAYGEVGRGLIEVHHLVPMAELTKERKTLVSELLCICSNCHFAIHNGDVHENLRRLRIIFQGVSRTNPNKANQVAEPTSHRPRPAAHD